MILKHFNNLETGMKSLFGYFKFNLKKMIFLYALNSFIPVFAQSYVEFFKAIETDQAQVVQRLLQRGFDPNTPSPQLQPALTLALQTDALMVAETLIAWPSIKVNQVNPNDETPLMMAALKGHLKLAIQLLARGAQVNKPGWSPLHYAAAGGHAPVVRWLLEQNADINAASPNGTTPLMMAAHYGNPEVTRLLIEQGADLKLKNQLGLTALDFAMNGPHKESVTLIEARTR